MVTFCVEIAVYNGFWRKDKRGDRSDKKTKKRCRKLLDDLKERRE